MDDAWQSQDIAPSSTSISIPTHEAGLGSGAHIPADDPSWHQNHSPGRDRAADGPRRSSRSRSPVPRDGDKNRVDGRTNPGNNLHVSSLSQRVDARELEAAFAKIGRVQKASVMYDPHSRESRGFGFVTMETAEEAEAAVTALNHTEVLGKVITVEKARRGRARTPTPGRYYGPPKRMDLERQYDPRPYDSRYVRDHDRRGGGGGGGGRYDDYKGGREERDRYRDYERDRYRDYDRGGRHDDRRH